MLSGGLGGGVKGGATDATLTTSDITTNDVSTTKHGFAPKAPNVATQYLDGTGAYSVPAGSGLTAATQAQQEAATSNTVGATPLNQQYHPSAAKFWAKFAGADATINASYNVTSIVRDSAGNYTITIATDFSSGNWCCLASCSLGGGNEGLIAVPKTMAAGTIAINVFKRADGTDFDPVSCYVVGFGDQ